jgi:hypothetical protein
MAENLRGTSGNDTLVIATAETNYLGMAGDDTYIISQDFVQPGNTININDTQGANRIQLVGGLEIASSQLATLANGQSQLFLTLSNGTNILINGASNIGFDVGGAFGGAGSTPQTFAQVTQTLGYALVPEPNQPAMRKDVPVVIGEESQPGPGPIEPMPTIQHGSYEQFMLELINRARSQPFEEAARYEIDLNQDLDPGTLSGTPMQPVFANGFLLDAARQHSDWMLAADSFSHEGQGGSSPGDRMGDAGYAFIPPWTWGENISWKGATGTLPSDLTDYILDQHEGLFLSAGHRVNILGDEFREIGIGQSLGGFTSNQMTYQASMITQNFATSGDDVFLGGVAYEDLDGDAFYTPGEGLGGLTISLPDLGLETQTSDAGGYQLAVPSGTHEVVFSGDALEESMVTSITIGSENEKLDIVLSGAENDASEDGLNSGNAFNSDMLGIIGLNEIDDLFA